MYAVNLDLGAFSFIYCVVYQCHPPCYYFQHSFFFEVEDVQGVVYLEYGLGPTVQRDSYYRDKRI
jgi:hypothetical protein